SQSCTVRVRETVTKRASAMPTQIDILDCRTPFVISFISPMKDIGRP
ncbi:MAG: hypothetical protein JET69_05620, partial [Methanomassiliicoccales archaeon]|nr:hypothetical protein [Methanomassiliicoccales archaeon]